MMPTTPDDARALTEWADSVPMRPEPICKKELVNKLDYMRSVLPSRNMDLSTGQNRLAVYVSRLLSFGEPALAHMARRACDELEWFPSVKWCVDAARSYRGEQQDAQTARALCHRYRQQVMADWMARLRRGELSQQEIDAAPEQYRRIAETTGLLRWDDAAGCHRLRGTLDAMPAAMADAIGEAA